MKVRPEATGYLHGLEKTRTHGEQPALAAPLRDVVRDLDVNQPVFGLQTFASFYQPEATVAQLLVLRTATAMGMLGLTLARGGSQSSAPVFRDVRETPRQRRPQPLSWRMSSSPRNVRP
ncbi:MAG: hypothetical protein HYU27_07275 [Acidobacteria bacterium]|nr:hypothetical protein [Acidobacteriota bacterium]